MSTLIRFTALLLLMTAVGAADNATCASCGMKAVDAKIAAIAFKPNTGPKVKWGEAAPLQVGFCSQGCHDDYAKDPEAKAALATQVTLASETCLVCAKPASGKIPVIAFKPNDGPRAGVKDQPIVLGFCSDGCHETYRKDPAAFEEKAKAAWQSSRNVQVK